WLCYLLTLPLSLLSRSLCLFLSSVPLSPAACEDLIAESVRLDTLICILRWSSQPYGSKWVRRQVVHFLCEEFSSVVASDILFELSQEHLVEAIRSDYLQASENDILKAVIKWAEHQLAKRLSDEEPNVLSGTAHSVTKRGVKKRDLDAGQLREIIAELVPHIRIAHVLPAKSEVLADSMKRGLISSPPADMLPTPESRKSRVWFCLKASGIGAKPRLFTPYIEEAKAVLDDLMSEQTSLDKVRVSRISSVPDTLYMVDSAITDFPRLSAGSPHSFEERVPVSLRDEIPSKLWPSFLTAYPGKRARGGGGGGGREETTIYSKLHNRTFFFFY
uniref:BACK domain-containing protein n=1 Tax=Callorhinchus milii TaxID=7868 RepID=A0A4W3GS52_CALMI